MAKSEFLTFLVDETLNLQGSGEGNLSSFELKLTDYHLDFLKGEFIPQFQVLRFHTPFGSLDVPMNWKLFSCESEDYQLLDHSNDDEGFYSILKTAWDIPLEKVLILHADGFCYLVGLKAGEEYYLRDLVNPQEWLKSA